MQAGHNESKHADSRAPRATYKHFMTNPVDRLLEKLQRTIKVCPIAVRWDGSNLVSDTNLILASITRAHLAPQPR